MKDVINLKNFALMLGVIFLTLGAINSTLENVSGGAACFAAGVVVVILFHFDVKSFNVFGLAAELREKLSEADEILRKLRGISLPISEIAITTASQAGRYDSVVPRKKLYDFVRSISEELKDMNVPNESIEKIKDSWYLATSIDMSLPIHKEIQRQLSSHRAKVLAKVDDVRMGRVTLNDEESQALNDELTNIECDNFNYQEDVSYINPNYKSYPSHFLKLINDLTGIPEEDKAGMLLKINEHILDLEYLINHKEIRRPELWFK